MNNSVFLNYAKLTFETKSCKALCIGIIPLEHADNIRFFDLHKARETVFNSVRYNDH